jgi:acyl-coenzyme A thioesterase PaaI-like protein
MTTPPVIQDYYADDFAHCYGCGRHNPAGIHLRSHWEGDEIVARITPRPEYTAFPGLVYGGFLASLVDCHAMATAAAHTERLAGRSVGEQPAPRFVTGSLHVDFLKPTPSGVELVLRARPKEIGRRKVVVEVRLSAGEVETVRGEVVAVAIPDSMVGMGTTPPAGHGDSNPGGRS